MFTILETERGLFTVGHYDPTGKWHPHSDHSNIEEAENKAAFLNGNMNPIFESLENRIERIEKALKAIESKI